MALSLPANELTHGEISAFLDGVCDGQVPDRPIYMAMHGAGGRLHEDLKAVAQLTRGLQVVPRYHPIRLIALLGTRIRRSQAPSVSSDEAAR